MKGEVIPGGFPPGAEADAVHTRADGEPAGWVVPDTIGRALISRCRGIGARE